MEKPLEELWKEIWGTLVRGGADRKHPYHFPTIGTIGQGTPELRTVILRKVLPKQHELWFYTDYRSPKVSQLKANPSLAWHFYDPMHQEQIRVQTTVSLHNKNDIAREVWGQIPRHGRKDYLSFAPPGELLQESPSRPTDPGQAESELGFQNFCLITATATLIDYLKLRREEEHLRAIFQLSGNEWLGNWVVA